MRAQPRPDHAGERRLVLVGALGSLAAGLLRSHLGRWQRGRGSAPPRHSSTPAAAAAIGAAPAATSPATPSRLAVRPAGNSVKRRGQGHG
ncbi:MAG: hypothetical protein ABSB49_07975 [Polyangia bacterium]